jgi:hypothetical protein
MQEKGILEKNDLYQKFQLIDYHLKEACYSSDYECSSTIVKLINEIRKEFVVLESKDEEKDDQRRLRCIYLIGDEIKKLMFAYDLLKQIPIKFLRWRIFIERLK